VNYGIVLDIRTYPVHPLGFKGQMENLAFNFGLICAKIGCDSITAITPFMKNMLCKDYGFDPNEMGVWSSGVAMDRFSPGAIPEKEVEDLRNILGLTGKFIVLHHGVLQNGRGLLDAVIATRELIMSGDYQNFIMVFLGSGPMSDVIRKTALDWGIDCHVLVLEPVEHFLVPYYIALADVGILPFPDEMWLRVSSPIKLGEYLSMGKPVIVTNIEAHWDVIGSADCGLYVSPGSPQEIAQAFRQLISLSPTQRSEMGKTGRDIALNYTWDEQAKRLEKALLESLRNLET
jgi:glycosyltransferase involved in cell wall biosynthesis